MHMNVDEDVGETTVGEGGEVGLVWTVVDAVGVNVAGAVEVAVGGVGGPT